MIRRIPLIVVAILIIVAVGSGVLDYYLPQMGDDLRFWNFLGLDAYKIPNRQTISFILAHIVGCNGRVFDYMGPVVINLLPGLAAAVVMGLMAGLYYFSVWYAARVPQRGHASFSAALLTLVLLVTPWWDSLFLRVCQFNYTWGTTFCLLFIAKFFQETSAKPTRLGLFLLCLLGICAGCAHEQTGVAMCAAFFLWTITGGRYRKLSLRQKAMLGALLFGALLTVCTPAIWMRAGDNRAPQYLSTLILTTYPAFLALLSLLAALAVFKSGRSFVWRMAKQADWLVMLTAAFVAALIGVYSGIPGRTGVFTEACSLVLLARMALQVKFRINKAAAGIVCALCLLFITAHFCAAVASQKPMRVQHDQVVNAYKASPDGIVYYDYDGRYDAHPLALNRVKGVADGDDDWNLFVLAETYRDDERPLIVLPSAMRGCLDELTDSVTCGSTTIYSQKPTCLVVTADGLLLQYYPGPAPRSVQSTTLEDGRQIWVAAPRVRDPGDYNLPVIYRE